MLFLILIDRCMKCCCIHCQDNCFPATELVIYNAQDETCKCHHGKEEPVKNEGKSLQIF